MNNNIKKSFLRLPNRVTVKKLSNDQKARIATSSIAIANKCKIDRQSVRNNAIDKLRGLEIIDGAQLKKTDADRSDKSMNSSPEDKEAVFKEQFQEYLKKKDEKAAAEKNYFDKHPPFYVGGKNVNDSGKKSKIPTFKSCITPRSKLPLKLSTSFNNAKLNAKSANSAVKHVDSQNLERQKHIHSMADKQEAPLAFSSTFTANASNDEIPTIDNKHEETQAKCLWNTFSTQDRNKFGTLDASSSNEAVLQKAWPSNASSEKTVETIVNMKTNDTKTKIAESPAVSTTKSILKLESPQNRDLNVQVRFENILEIRRSNRKTRYTGSFTAMATVSDGKRRRSRSIGGRTSDATTPEKFNEFRKLQFCNTVTTTTCSQPKLHTECETLKYTENVNETVDTEKLLYENEMRFDSIGDESKENCPPPPRSTTASLGPSLQNRASPFVESTPNCSNAPSTSKRRKTMTPFELNVDLVKAPEINFNDSCTSPLRAPNSILKSGKRSTVGHKTVHFELSASSSISFDSEILEDEENENDILSNSSPPLIVSNNREKEAIQENESLISPFLRTRRSIYPARENLIDF